MNRVLFASIIVGIAVMLSTSTIPPSYGGEVNGGEGEQLAPEVCSEIPEEKNFICKKVFIIREQGGSSPKEVEVNEIVTFTMFITVDNDSDNTWDNIIVKDNFGAELDVINCSAVSTGLPSPNTAALVTVGNSQKEKLVWTIGTLLPTETATLTCRIVTDTDPGDNQSYTECGPQEFNSGANLKFTVGDPAKKRSFETGPVLFNVLCDL